jgi:nucleotide-binding universal stress UspA family protein
VFKIILVALDSSELSKQIMQTLNQLNPQPPSKIVLAHVISLAEAPPDRPADQPHLDLEVGLYRQVEQQLLSYQASLSCQSELEIVTGDPAEEIIRLANIHHATLIIMGSRGLTGVNRILQRSVSGEVVEEASCSVLVVKPMPD